MGVVGRARSVPAEGVEDLEGDNGEFFEDDSLGESGESGLGLAGWEELRIIAFVPLGVMARPPGAKRPCLLPTVESAAGEIGRAHV